MPITTGLAIFFLIWWLVLFAVLPWGIRSQDEQGEVVPGSDPGAPAIPKLRSKLLWTTLVSLVVFAAFYVIYAERLVTIESLMAPFETKTSK
jgi:predicted secreted protein